jgi:hypothetical protein
MAMIIININKMPSFIYFFKNSNFKSTHCVYGLPLSTEFTAMRVSDVFGFVISEMRFEINRRLELLFADGTLELLQVRVDQHVTVYQVTLSVVLAAKFAPVIKTKR